MAAFLFKTIRADDLNFWDGFVHSLINGENLELRGNLRKAYTSRLGTNGKYEIIPTDKTSPDRNARWTAEIKAETTRAQSVSYANPDNDYMPDAFGLDDRELLVGIALPPENIQRISLYDDATIVRPYDAETVEEARAYLDEQLQNNIYFSSLTELEKVGKKNPSGHNEIMARLKWLENNDDYKIMIFTNNLESRLVAQARALDLHLAIKQRRGKQGLSTEGSYAPKIFFYPSLNEYTSADQQQDLQTSESSPLTLAIQGIGHNKALSFDDRVLILNSELGRYSRHFTGFMIEPYLNTSLESDLFNALKNSVHDQKKLSHLLKTLPETSWALFLKNFGNNILNIIKSLRDLESFLELLPEKSQAIFLMNIADYKDGKFRAPPH